MRYKRLLLVCGAVIWLTAGCAPETQEAKEEIRQEEATVEAGDTGSIDTEKEEDRSEEAVEEESDRKTVKIYYIDDMGELASREAEVEDERSIWAELKKDSVLAEECELLGLKVNEADRTMELDLNQATGDWIRSFGTAGETEILACLTNTYLDAYGCDKIRITEEGEELSTSHGAAVGGYMERITL